MIVFSCSDTWQLPPLCGSSVCLVKASLFDSSALIYFYQGGQQQAGESNIPETIIWFKCSTWYQTEVRVLACTTMWTGDGSRASTTVWVTKCKCYSCRINQWVCCVLTHICCTFYEIYTLSLHDAPSDLIVNKPLAEFRSYWNGLIGT